MVPLVHFTCNLSNLLQFCSPYLSAISLFRMPYYLGKEANQSIRCMKKPPTIVGGHPVYNHTLEGLNPFNRSAFNSTDTELKLMAAPAIIGFNNGPPNR
jgi:hypothetical protein